MTTPEKVRWWRPLWKQTLVNYPAPPQGCYITIKDGLIAFSVRGEFNNLHITMPFNFSVGEGDPFKPDPYLGMSGAQIVATIQTYGSTGLWPEMKRIMAEKGLR